MYPSQNQALAEFMDMERWSSVSGLESKQARGRVQPGSGLGADAQDWGPRGLLLSSYRAVGQMMSTMFYPLVTFVLLVICIGYWAVTALYPSYSPHWRARGGR